MNNCSSCKYYDASVDCCNADDVCYVDGLEKGRAEAVEEAAVLIRQFTRDWNMTNHKRISYIASDELISYLRNHIKERSNAE